MPIDAETTTDRLLGGAVILRQRRDGHRAGTDAVLLAGMVEAKAGEHVIDLGSATGAVGLMLATRVPSLCLTLLERDPCQAALAAENVALNGWVDRVSVQQFDAFSPLADWPAIMPADLVVTNPPFFEDGGGHRASPDARRASAHVMAGGGLQGWVATASGLLKPKGRLVMIHRADALEACLSALRPHFGSPALQPIQPRRDRAANRILVRARKGGRAALTLLPALVLHEDDGRFTPEAARLHDPGLSQGSGTNAAR